MSKKIRNKEVDHLFDAILTLKNKEECYTFFEDVCTVNELLSIIENTSLMGIPYPPAIKKAIEVLQKRAQHIDDDIQEMIDKMEDDEK